MCSQLGSTKRLHYIYLDTSLSRITADSTCIVIKHVRVCSGYTFLYITEQSLGMSECNLCEHISSPCEITICVLNIEIIDIECESPLFVERALQKRVDMVIAHWPPNWVLPSCSLRHV